jgi:hypothetical protein
MPVNLNLKPLIERISFSNIRLNKLERGDLLYFGYNGSREDSVINPLIIVSGVDQKSHTIQGVNLRSFYANKELNIGKHVLNRYAHIYWDREEDEENHITYTKKHVGYYASNAFLYETLGIYREAFITKVIGNQRQQVNLMETYWRSYKPSNMRFLNDQFAKMDSNNILVNLAVAEVIMNVAPTQVTLQPRIA